MAEFEAHDDGVEVNGQTIAAFLDGVPSAFEGKTQRILETQGIGDPQPDQWYRQQDWLDAFEEVADDIGENTLKTIGKAIPENADWPPEVSTVEEGIESIDEAYQLNHRGGDIGHYLIESVADGEATIRCTNPYPCAFDHGIIDAVTAEFATGISSLDEVGADCRDSGGDECTYRVTW